MTELTSKRIASIYLAGTTDERAAVANLTAPVIPVSGDNLAIAAAKCLLEPPKPNSACESRDIILVAKQFNFDHYYNRGLSPPKYAS
jgi:hypothetical protein